MGAQRWRLAACLVVFAACSALLLAVPSFAGSIPDGTVTYEQVVPATHAVVPTTAKGVAYVASAHQVVLSDSTDGLLYFYDADTGSLLATSSGTPGQPFQMLGDVAPRTGGVWVADTQRKKYYSVNLNGTVATSVAMPLLGTDGIDATSTYIWGVNPTFGIVNSTRTDAHAVTTSTASLNYPTDVAAGAAGPYVTDTYNNRIVRLNGSGAVSKEWSTASLDASFTYPGYVDTDSQGRVWVSSASGVYGIDPSVVSTGPASYRASRKPTQRSWAHDHQGARRHRPYRRGG